MILDEADTKHFHLIGLVCGLAAYNNVIVDLPFPLVLYKKLLGRSVSACLLVTFMSLLFTDDLHVTVVYL